MCKIHILIRVYYHSSIIIDMNCVVFVLIIGLLCIILQILFISSKEGIGALVSPHGTGFGAWPENLYGSTDTGDQYHQYNNDLADFMRHSDGYDERLSRPMSADWSYTN